MSLLTDRYGESVPVEVVEELVRRARDRGREELRADLRLLADANGHGERLLKAAEHAPKGGVTMNGKEFRGGEFIPANSAEASADLRTDQQFRTLFQTWKKMDARPNGVIAIPSVHPVEKLQFTSNFGIRSDPFRGTAAMHAGVDIPGPVGTPIYATADGKVVSVDVKFSGYGKMVEIDHGFGYRTRYAHMHEFAVRSGQNVKRGDLIGYVGNTGLSTAPHLHYEVLINGSQVDPVHYFYNDLSAAEYEKVLELASVENQSLGM